MLGLEVDLLNDRTQLDEDLVRQQLVLLLLDPMVLRCTQIPEQGGQQQSLRAEL